VWDSGLSKGKYQVLSLKELEKIHQTAISILDEVGVPVGKEPFWRVFSNAGCKVERNDRVKVLPCVVAEALEKVSHQVLMRGHGGSLPSIWERAGSAWERVRLSATPWI